MLSMARKSLTEIATLTGLSPQEAGEKLNQLLNTEDWRSLRQEERLLLLELRSLLEDAKVELEFSKGTKEYTPLLRTVLSGLKMIFDRIDHRERIIDDDLTRIDEAQARLWASAIRLALERAAFELEKRYGISPEESEELIMDALPLAVRELEGHIK